MMDEMASEHQRRIGWTAPASLKCWHYGNDLTAGAWTDRSGNGNHAALTGSPTLNANGMVCASGKFATISETPSSGPGITLCCWVYPTTINTTHVTIGGIRYASEYFLAILSNGNAQGGGGGVAAEQAGVSTGGWFHITYRWDGVDTQYVGVDGVETSNARASNVTASQPLWLGAYDATGNLGFVGTLDGCMMFNADIGTAGLAAVRAYAAGSHA